ncbi:MAG: hypothetical protein GDA36_11480 [Rhodobacteraceae bacterium]|nr:hypothetical protein [Paracoccaceae bacterium]
MTRVSNPEHAPRHDRTAKTAGNRGIAGYYAFWYKNSNEGLDDDPVNEATGIYLMPSLRLIPP